MDDVYENSSYVTRRLLSDRRRRKSSLGSTASWSWDVELGACTRDGRSLWNKIPDSACSAATCIIAPTLNSCVALVPGDNASPLKPQEQSTCKACTSLADNAKINGGEIVVSFIYTLYKSPAMAVKSIVSVLQTLHELPGASEIVVVDDNSPVDMGLVKDLLDKMKNWLGYRVVFVQNTENKGYGASNNIAMQNAKGKYALFMNSDVTVRPGWLAALVNTIEHYPRAGMVGPLMLNAEGKVQEAGGTVMRYGVPSNFGRNTAPASLPYLHARVADYISAACLLVRRELFIKLGLFDPQFEPAYYEDTDAALTHLQNGWLTIIQPLSVVLHEEGQSIVSEAKEKLMVRNQKLFYNKHKNLLDGFCPDVSCARGSRLVAETFSAHSREATHILVLDTHVPRPDRDSGSLRTSRMLEILIKQGYKLSLNFLDYFDSDLRYVTSLLADGVYVQPRSVFNRMLDWHKAERPGMESKCPWDAVLITKPRAYVMFETALRSLCKQVPVIYDLVDVFFLNKSPTRTSENARGADKANQVRLVRQSMATLVVNHDEAALLRREVPNARIEVISNMYPRIDHSQPFVPFSQRKGALFVGNMCHEPNRQAVEFIFKEIMGSTTTPLDHEITMVVSNSDRCGGVPSGVDITVGLRVLRDVDDAKLAELHDHALVVIAPLKSGNGVKGKVTYAMHRGTPVIGTAVAADGLHAVDKTHMVLAETGLEFRAAMSMLALDENTWNRLRTGGLELVERYFSIDVASETLIRVLNKAGGFQSPINSTKLLKKCPGIDIMTTLPASCKNCWYCADNPYYYRPPIV
jgi:GT2 family glycosyltransferase/glycosyltransferase involved in cell wall biosynthesis